MERLQRECLLVFFNEHLDKWRWFVLLDVLLIMREFGETDIGSWNQTRLSLLFNAKLKQYQREAEGFGKWKIGVRVEHSQITQIDKKEKR